MTDIKPRSVATFGPAPWLIAAGVLIVLGCSCGPLPGRWDDSFARVEEQTTLPPGSTMLPDSLGGVRRPYAIVLNPDNGRIYIAGSFGDVGVAVIDAATGRKVGLIPARDAKSLWLNPITNRLYIRVGRRGSDDLIVVDCSADTVVRRLERNPLSPRCVNLTDNKVYATLEYFWHTQVAIIDGKTNRVLRAVNLGPVRDMASDTLIWNPTNDAVYCMDTHSGAIVVIDGKTDREVVRIRDKSSLWLVCLNTRENKLYATSHGRGDSSVAVIDCRTNRISSWLPVPCGVMAAVYTPLNNKVYVSVRVGSGADTSGVVVVDGATDSVLARISTPGEPDELLYDSTSNRVYCLGYSAGWVAAIDCDSDSLVGIVRPGDDMSRAVLYPPANRLCCLGGQGDVYTVDCARFAVIETLTLGYRVETMLYNRQRDKLYCANDIGHSLAVVDGASGRVRGTIEVGRSPSALAFNRTGATLYCANEDSRTVSVIDCRTDRVVATVSVSNKPTILCYSPKADRLFCAGGLGSGGSPDSTIAVIDCRTNTVAATLPMAGWARCLAYDSIRDRVYCASSRKSGGLDSEGQVCGFDARDLSRVMTTRFVGFPRDLRYDAAHDRLYCSHGSPYMVTAIDCKTGKVGARIWAGNSPEALCLHPTRNRLYCASRNYASGRGTEGKLHANLGTSNSDGQGRALAVIDTDTDSTIATIPMPPGPASLCYVPETDRIYCACSGSIVVVDCATNRRIATLAADYPRALNYSPQHRTVFASNLHRSSVSFFEDATVPTYRR